MTPVIHKIKSLWARLLDWMDHRPRPLRFRQDYVAPMPLQYRRYRMPEKVVKTQVLSPEEVAANIANDKWLGRNQLIAWLEERQQNCIHHANKQDSTDKLGWLVDAYYLASAINIIRESTEDKQQEKASAATI